MDDFWGDRVTREHLRERELIKSDGSRILIEEPSLEPIDEPSLEPVAELITVDVPELIVDEQQGDEDKQQDEQVVAPTIESLSLADQVWQVLQTFPNEKMSRILLSETLDMSAKSVTGSILTLQRRGLPVYNDKGIYWYDPQGQPVVRSRPGRAASNRNSDSEFPDLELAHLRATVLYDAFQKYADGNTLRMRSDQIIDQMAPADKKLFMFKKFIARGTVTYTHKYLIALGCIRISGPIKFLLNDPRNFEPSEKAHKQALILDMSKATRRGIKPPNTRQKAAETRSPESESGSMTKITTETIEEMLDRVNPQDLATALATGMWNRYEWALGQLGETREQLGRLEEALRVRDEEITRLRRFLPRDVNITDLAHQLLSE